jgi:hypothetical protein
MRKMIYKKERNVLILFQKRNYASLFKFLMQGSKKRQQMHLQFKKKEIILFHFRFLLFFLQNLIKLLFNKIHKIHAYLPLITIIKPNKQ